jgi:uncharacterized membrane protein
MAGPSVPAALTETVRPSWRRKPFTGVWKHDPVAVTIERAKAMFPMRGWLTSRSSRVPDPAMLALLTFATTWSVVFGVLVVRRHHGFWDLGFDMGIHDQSVWLLAHGRDFMTVRGLDVFGHHATPGYFLLVPAYWLGAGPDFLNVLQVVVLGLGVVPLYLLAQERHLPSWAAAALGGAFLLHPATQFFTWELFHPEVMAITPLLCAYLCAVRRSWRWFALWAVLAVCWKEDVALAVIVLGLLVAWRGDRRIGAATVGIALAWFLLWTVILFPQINGGHVQSEGIYAGVGGSAGGMIDTLFTDPGAITSRVFSSESGDFAWRLMVPFGFVPVFALGVVGIGVPQFLLDVVSDVPWTRVINHHYAALIVAALAIAAVEGAAFARRRMGRVLGVAAPIIVVAGAVFGTLAWGPSPIGAEYGHGFWPPAVDSRIETKRAVVSAVTNDGSVSATYGLVPQFSRRAEIYEFPNPWESANFGVEGASTRDPDHIEWLVIDRTVLDPAHVVLLASILENGFTVVLDRDDLLVAHRDRASGRR